MKAQALPAGEEKVRAVRTMFDTIAPRYDLVNRIMTFGMDIGWRRRAVSALGLPRTSRVGDLACGTGDMCRELAATGLEPIGLDMSFGMLTNARTSVPLVQGDAIRLPVRDASLDGITCAFALRNVLDLRTLFTECARVVRPGGRLAILEVAEPPNPVLKLGHGIYFGRVVPVVGGLLSNRDAYRYLPKSVAYLPPTAEMMTMLREAGFPDAQRVLLSVGICQLLVGSRIRT